MIIRNDMELAAAKQLAIDLNCSPEDFFKYENTVTLPRKNEGRRGFTAEPHFFRAASMGMGTVICADKSIAPFVNILAQSKSGAEICAADTVASINRELFTHGYCIGIFNQYYLPKTPYHYRQGGEGYTLRVFAGDELKELYPYGGFTNALLYRNEGDRRDILAVCAINGRRMIGIAGASCDSKTMAQIGIDVLPDFRGMGVGTALVSACASEVLRSGMIPYYGTWSGNVISQRLAVSCGFTPTWCEMFSVKLAPPPRPAAAPSEAPAEKPAENVPEKAQAPVKPAESKPAEVKEKRGLFGRVKKKKAPESETNPANAANAADETEMTAETVEMSEAFAEPSGEISEETANGEEKTEILKENEANAAEAADDSKEKPEPVTVPDTEADEDVNAAEGKA